MARKVWLLSLAIALVVSLGVGALKGFGKDTGLGKDGREIEELSEKIEESLKNQQDIIARLEDIRNELDIIRIRASRR